MGVRRIVPYVQADDLATVEEFYCGLLGLEVWMTPREGWDYLGLGSPDTPSAQLVAARSQIEDPMPTLGVDVGSADAVDGAHAEALRRGLEILYGPADEPWGIRRFFVRDPSGAIVSVLGPI